MRRRHATWLVCVVACADVERAPDLAEVRVSTHRQLDPIVPPTGLTTSANLQELVCPDVGRELEVRPIDATTFALRRKASTSRSLEELSRALRHHDLVSVGVEKDSLRVTLKPDGDPTLFCLEDGEFRVVSYSPTELVLERTRGAGIRRIRALAFRDSEEEWRRFLAREVDVVPGVNRSQLPYLRELPSIKLVMSPTARVTGFRFNTARVPFELRRAISLAIHRKAVTRSLGYDDGAAVPAAEDALGAAGIVQARQVPSPFRVLTVRGETEMQRAALVLEENLERVGIPAKFDVLDVDRLFDAMRRGEFEANLFFVGLSDPGYFRSGDPINTFRYANPDFDAAAEAGNANRIREIIAQDVLEVPIFRVPDVVAADARLCGIKPKLVDLSWLGEVHLCAPGETE